VMAPDPGRMLAQCDAALLIGDAALLFDHAAAGVEKTDLGLASSATVRMRPTGQRLNRATDATGPFEPMATPGTAT
jgi:hypothetical protein